MASIKRFLVGAAAAGGAFAAVYWFVIRPWHLRWGATDEEVARSLPGDDLVPNAKLNATHAVTIRAAAAEVWPWLVQIGQGRGGFYSYAWIENMMGLDIHNADRIIPEFQHLEVGDTIPLAPGGFGIPVAALEAEKYLLLHGDSRTDEAATAALNMPAGSHLAATWLFYLDEQADGTTRLIERIHIDWGPPALGGLDRYLFWEPGVFLMERKMLLGIKERVEAHKGARL